ncbi:MAG: exodeoxyribonuclease VII small subunit [Clostridiaceae bacterium]|nr:exodeoxyribonuclease VII small subunit [Clostridiaceae bacterium]
MEKNNNQEKLKIEKEPASFQKALDEIAEIVAALESTQTDLEKSVNLFKRGTFLTKWSENYLNKMEEEIKKITENE